MRTKTGDANAGTPGFGHASQGPRLRAAMMAASPGRKDVGLGRLQARGPEGGSGGAAAAAAVPAPAVLSPLARAQLAEKMKKTLSSNGSFSSLTQAFKSGGRGPNHDPAQTAQDCMCCTPQSLNEMAEMEDRRLRRGEQGGGLSSSGRLQIAMALCALVALVSLKWRSGFSKL